MKFQVLFALAQASLLLASPVPSKTENMEPRQAITTTMATVTMPDPSAIAAASASGSAEMQAMMKEIMAGITKAGETLGHMIEVHGGAGILGGGQASGSAGAAGGAGAGAGASAGGKA